MKTALVTGAFGDRYLRMAEVTFPNLKAYADRIGADFHALEERRFLGGTPHWEKLQLADFLGNYDRVIWSDCDILVRADCPNLFDLVPESMIGAWDESVVGPWDYPGFLDKWSALTKLPRVRYPGWHANTGVAVFSKRHLPLFSPPSILAGYEVLWEQGWINYQAAARRAAFMDFGWKFNHMFIAPPSRHESFVIHYCGTINGSGYSKDIPSGGDYIDVIKNDLEIWRKRGLIP
jgi:hypothetical protein